VQSEWKPQTALGKHFYNDSIKLYVCICPLSAVCNQNQGFSLSARFPGLKHLPCVCNCWSTGEMIYKRTPRLGFRRRGRSTKLCCIAKKGALIIMASQKTTAKKVETLYRRRLNTLIRSVFTKQFTGSLRCQRWKLWATSKSSLLSNWVISLCWNISWPFN